MNNKPLVSIVVVNYNSRKKWDVVKLCIESILKLDYNPLEVIIVDNGSTDGSYELIMDLIKEYATFNSGTRSVKVIRLSKNYGFAVANIIGYNFINASSKYLVLMNNDLCPQIDCLKKLIDILEKHPGIGGIQGIILSWNDISIDSYGCLATDHGLLYAIGHGLTKHEITKPTIVTYVDGAFAIYRIGAIRRCGGLFQPYFFMWGDDYELGVRLWRCGYILIAVPIIVARHFRGLTVGRNSLSYILEYWSWVSNIAVMVVMYGNPWILQMCKRIPSALAATLIKRSKAILRGFIDGLRIGLKLRHKMHKKYPWIKIPKEPRLKVKTISELALLIKLYLRYRSKASQIYYQLVARSLGRLVTHRRN